MANTNLGKARATKNDEFYTQWADIQKEVNALRDYDPDVFRDKVILLPCDDPQFSNFTKLFALNFELFGIKKLISTSYAPRSNPAFDELQPSLFDVENPYGEDDPQYDEDKAWERGRVFTLERNDLTGDGKVDIDDLRWEYLQDDGDFRSDEVTALRDEADMVVTNPPFSLFGEFVEWLIDGGVEFAVIGNSNAITKKDIFPLIKNNKMWLGATGNENDMVFEVPANAIDQVKPADREKARKLGYDGNYTRLGNSCWFTNIPHGRRREEMKLLTKAENVRFSRFKKVRELQYPAYDNYDAIEVCYSEAIPSDEDGVMGVPVSFLSRYNPDQFEIVGISANGLVEEDFKLPHFKRHNEPFIDGAKIYQRLFIRNKHPEVSNENATQD